MGTHETTPLFRFEAVLREPKRMTYYELDAAGAVVATGNSCTEQPPSQDGHHVYELLHSGGFLKLYLRPHGRTYWYAQALSGNRVPDWKLHISVHPDHQVKTTFLLIQPPINK